MSQLIDLTGQDFGYWHVIERAPNNKGGKARWKCLCTACGTIKDVAGAHLRSGASTNCGCIRAEKLRQSTIKNEEGKTYGFLKVKRMAIKEEQPRTDRTGVYWICDCLNCGNKDVVVFGDYLRNGDTQSCGCLNSKNEAKIINLLDLLKFNYKRQYKFNDLTSTGRACDKLMFDFAIFNEDKLLYLIEYDGAQHFNKSHEFSEGEFEVTRRNDLMKNKYCFEHNIPLIRIPYTVKYTPEDLKLETTRFLLTPENEEEYYKRK